MLLCLLACPVTVGLGGADEGLGVGAHLAGQLLRLPFSLGDPGLGGAHGGVGVCLGAPDRLGRLCLRLVNAGLGFLADPLGLGGVRGGGLGQALVSLARPGLLGGQVLAHLLGRLVRRAAHLVSRRGAALCLGPLGLCGDGALLGRRTR